MMAAMNHAAEEYRSELLDRLKRLGYAVKYLRAAVRDSNEAYLVAARNVLEATASCRETWRGTDGTGR